MLAPLQRVAGTDTARGMVALVDRQTELLGLPKSTDEKPLRAARGGSPTPGPPTPGSPRPDPHPPPGQSIDFPGNGLDRFWMFHVCAGPLAVVRWWGSLPIGPTGVVVKFPHRLTAIPPLCYPG